MTLLFETATRLKFPPSWTRQSRECYAALGATQAEIDEIESNLARFRRLRDEMAVENYAARLPVLRRLVSEKRNELSPLIAKRRWLLKIPKQARSDEYRYQLERLDEAIKRVGSEYQAASGELANIERDYPLRTARLGIQ